MNQTRYTLIALALILLASSGCKKKKEDDRVEQMFYALSIQNSPAHRWDDEPPYYPTISAINRAEKAARVLMKRDGWVYIKGARDCDNFAQKMSIEMQHYIAVNYPESHGKSIAIGVDPSVVKDGVPHMVVKAYFAELQYVNIDY